MTVVCLLTAGRPAIKGLPASLVMDWAGLDSGVEGVGGHATVMEGGIGIGIGIVDSQGRCCRLGDVDDVRLGLRPLRGEGCGATGAELTLLFCYPSLMSETERDG